MNDWDSAALSLCQSETVRGYEIRRLPLGEYLRALDALRNAPKALLAACFPGEDAAQVLSKLSHIDADGLGKLLLRAMTVVPGEAVRLVGVLTGVPEERLLGDPQIGLDGMAQMLEAFWRINGLGNFTQAARRAAAAVRTGIGRTGSSG